MRRNSGNVARLLSVRQQQVQLAELKFAAAQKSLREAERIVTNRVEAINSLSQQIQSSTRFTYLSHSVIGLRAALEEAMRSRDDMHQRYEIRKQELIAGKQLVDGLTELERRNHLENRKLARKRDQRLVDATSLRGSMMRRTDD